MNKTELHILMLEDDPLDAELNIGQLELLNEFSCDVKWVIDKQSYINALNKSVPDLILSDYTLPQYNGLEALNDMHSLNISVPFIFVTGTINEETAAGTIKAGAWDYVVKDRLFRLPLAIRAAIELKKEKEFAAKVDQLNRKLSAAVEQSPSHIIITDTNGIIEYVNSRFTEVTGFSADEAIGKKPSILKSGVHSREFYANIWNTINSNLTWRGEILNRKKNGDVFWELASISPLKNNKGEITHFISVKEDISAKKKMEEELIEARIKAEQSDKLKTAFLQNISHELRTPLNAITGFASLLNDTGTTAENKKEYIDIINRNCYQLIAMMEDIITASRIDSHTESLIEKKTNLKSMFEYLYSIYKDKSSVKKLDFEFEFLLNESEQYIITDEIKLMQILINLLNNSIKFTHSGSVIYGCSLKENFIEFYVKDTGIGIHPDMYNKIFERFFQANDDIHYDYGGRGLGLSITKSFVEFLGGKIWVESEIGKGSEFYFTLPNRKP